MRLFYKKSIAIILAEILNKVIVIIRKRIVIMSCDKQEIKLG